MNLRPKPPVPRASVTAGPTYDDKARSGEQWVFVERTPRGFVWHRYGTRAEADAAIEPAP